MGYLVLALKGVAYGITHIVPGLGGGLILILLGIYEQFVDVLGNLLDLKRLRQHLLFLVPLGVGMVVGMVALARIITIAMERAPAASMVFFMGLLIGTVPAVWRMHHDMRPTLGRVIGALGGLGVVVLLRTIEPHGEAVREITTPAGALYNLAVSFFAGGASVTPGLDGSYILLLGGTYKAVIAAVGDLTHLQIDWLALASTGLGAVAGIVLFSRLIHLALRRAPAVSAYVVLGMVLASIYGLWPQEPARTSAAVLVLAFVVGLALALVFGRSEPTSAGAPLPAADAAAADVAGN